MGDAAKRTENYAKLNVLQLLYTYSFVAVSFFDRLMKLWYI